MDMSLSNLQEMVKHKEVGHAIVRGIAKELDMTEQLNWLIILESQFQIILEVVCFSSISTGKDSILQNLMR